MPPKQVTISARISAEDAEFISGLSIEDAKTPSDKLRAIIAQARLRNQRQTDYVGTLQNVHELLQPVVRKIRKTEVENQVHSELILRLTEWIPDSAAFLVSSILELDDQQATEKLLQIERGVTDRLIRLMESVLQMAITERCDCYDPAILGKKLGPVLELCRIIMAQKA